jgi:hypothetical protein
MRKGLLIASVEKYKGLRLLRCENCLEKSWISRTSGGLRRYCDECKKMIEIQNKLDPYNSKDYASQRNQGTPDEIFPLKLVLAEIAMRVRDGLDPISVVGSTAWESDKISYERPTNKQVLPNSKCDVCCGYRYPTAGERRCRCQH